MQRRQELFGSHGRRLGSGLGMGSGIDAKDGAEQCREQRLEHDGSSRRQIKDIHPVGRFANADEH